MKNKNLIIGILAVLLVSSLLWNYTSNKTAIDDKVISERKNAKIVLKELNESVEKEAKTNYALAKTKVALLKAEIALTIDKSEKIAKEELDNAIKYLSEAKLTADEKTKVEIDKLITKVNNTKKSVVQKKDDTLDDITAIVAEAKALSEKYNQKLQAEKEKNIAIINRKYAELRAEEALLRAKIASEAEKTYVQAQDYLDEANEWYIRSKEYGTQEVNLKKKQIQKDIEKAKTNLKKKRKEVRNEIADILLKASEIIREK
jgi:hypothetical protein